MNEHDHTPEEERRIREAALDETIADSFPASDPASSLPNPDQHDAEGSGVEPADDSRPRASRPDKVNDERPWKEIQKGIGSGFLPFNEEVDDSTRAGNAW